MDSQEIIQRIVQGQNLNRRLIAEKLAMEPDFSGKLVQALAARSLLDIAEMSQVIADADADVKGELQKLNIQLQNTRWMAERTLPKIFGPKQQIEVEETKKLSSDEMSSIVKKIIQKNQGDTACLKY